MRTNPSQQNSLYLRSFGRNTAVLSHGESVPDVFRWVPRLPGNSVVLASASALRDPAMPAALRVACRQARTAGPVRLWLAVPGLAATDWGRPLAAELGAEVLVPEGPLTIVPDGSLFAGRWWLFRPGGSAVPVGSRYPTPPWEALLPESSGAIAVPAGLLVGGTKADHAAAQSVAVAQQHPRILLGAVAAPEQVATLLGQLPSELRLNCELVPMAPETRTAEWFQKVATLLGDDVLATTGPVRHSPDTGTSVVVPDEQGRPAWRAFAAVLRHTPTGQARVVRIGPPPDGWEARSMHYRREDLDVVARVVPAGLALVAAAEAGQLSAADRLPYEPDRLTVVIGSTGTPVSRAFADALRTLLGALPAGCLARLRLTVLGTVDPVTAAELRVAAAPHPLDLPQAAHPVTVSVPPAALVSAPPAPRPAPPPPPASTRATRPAPEPPEIHPQAAEEALDQPTEVIPLPTATETTAELPPSLVPVTSRNPWFDADHHSTAEEQTAFAAAAGTAYNDALAGVNSALALTPALRAGIAEGAKADFVAVRLYTGRTRFGAVEVNRALRAGDITSLRDYIACLISGLRRLPVHNGATFRRTTNESCYEAGQIVIEPGFVSACGDGAPNIADAGVDVVIWSRSGRRVRALSDGEPGEVVFAADTRFKVLAVPRDGLAAVLFRELPPDEQSTADVLDDTDQSVLATLREMLSSGVRRVDVDTERLAVFTEPIGLVAPQQARLTAAAVQ
ncbi:hypothetical protein [Saccharopolyspora thermophila]|uniref:hypothetical protein n=1 Tax=Saccharopolyspora thermophila TaxID=89367 RepID=UPI0016636867|nr:hypothetical protein [Saccharopolyspora subtropica]